MSDFEKAYQAYGADIHFLMVNMTDGYRETVETASEYIDKHLCIMMLLTAPQKLTMCLGYQQHILLMQKDMP